MRLGGPVFDTSTPKKWIDSARELGYSAVYAPVDIDASDSTVNAFRQAADESDIVIAEVGAWSNPLSPDPRERAEAIDKCTRSLDLAERLGALCCVNVAGSVGSFWCGHDPENSSERVFSQLVETVQRIVDAVDPQQAFYTLETSPWNYPHDRSSYDRLLSAIDRDRVAVHFDPVNMINSPASYYGNADLIRDFMRFFGTRIKSCHAKDILLEDEVFTVRFKECAPGEGIIDFRTFIEEIDSVDPEIPLMLEHLPTPDGYERAAAFLAQV
jgi:sugar phosphate isomerase/epimerase